VQENEQADYQPAKILFPATLIIRASCGCNAAH